MPIAMLRDAEVNMAKVLGIDDVVIEAATEKGVVGTSCL